MDTDPTLLGRLLNEFQRSFPLSSQPFAELASRLGTTEANVLAGYRQLLLEGKVGRIGAVVRPNIVGASTLAAVQVPPADLERVAQLVSGYAEVNHNYEREDDTLNLWFVVTAPSAARLEEVLREIAERIQLPVHDLRLEQEFRIDLGFDLKAYEP